MASSTTCGTDLHYPPRAVEGFYTRDELALLIQRCKSRKTLADVDVPTHIVERPYQTRAIRRVTQHFEDDHERAALLVMVTGSGKTRTVIALTDMLMRATGSNGCCFWLTGSHWSSRPAMLLRPSCRIRHR